MFPFLSYGFYALLDLQFVGWLGSGVMVMASLSVSASLEVIMEVMSDMLKSRPGAGILKQKRSYTNHISIIKNSTEH